jgi:hypothetical protein
MVDDEERRLLDIERNVLDCLERDWRHLKYAGWENLTADCFRNPRRAERYRELVKYLKEHPDEPPPHNDRPKGIGRFRDLAKQLVAAAPNRPTWEEPAPREQPAQYADPQPPAPTPKAAKRKPPSKEFLGKRRNMRTGELKVLARYLKRVDLKAIEAAFPGRDVFDPEEVLRREIGASVKLTEAEMFDIEQSATDHGLQRKWGRPGKPYRFSFRTITCYDLPDDDVELHRRQRSNKRTKQRLKTERLEKRTMQTAKETTATAGQKTIADLVAEQKARTKAQCEALYAALDPDEFISVGALTDRVRSDSAWRTVPSLKIERDIRTRLDMMTAAGRVENTATPGPRGSRLRLVRRAKIDRAAVQPRK